ncbi:endonuclease MutS2 [Haliangium ochraceum]|uniref:Endonuclease MutS2 n=1 Tax=Haliangium ochraceum (strain DSM 14365 / JCM 11303 / SMP-2) TaxID=502025 RepID=D0LH43_HALO1|nr:endonuclease MutS2 [Haliangium ochraceum]ACY18188.1 MutS2 family protein [Haliangium ochraceum DSM 14365]
MESKTLEDLGWDKLIAHLVRRTHTARGAAATEALPFFDQPDQAAGRMAEIAEARQLSALEAPLPFGGIRDTVTAIARASKGGALEAEDLLAVASTARGLTRLRKHLDQHEEDVPLLADAAAVIAPLPHVYEPIFGSFDDSGELADHASEALGPLRRRVGQITGQLEQRIRAYVDDQRYSRHLQDRYFTTRGDRYVVPVRIESRSQVRGIVHGSSGSGRTLFIEPEPVVELQNQLRMAQYEVDDEERRILAELTRLVADSERPLRQGIDAATHLDVVDACARLADDMLASVAAISTPRRIALMHARHPLMALSERPCVANDIILEPGIVMVLSGPNAGGKTVALKTAGLCALMVRAGMHLPVEPGSEMPWYAQVHSDIGDSQSIENDLSTFSAHLTKLRSYLSEAGSETLLLIDEVAVGTEPEQGAALAQAVLEALAARGVSAIVTTHYERLKALGASDERFANASVGFDIERMEPTFRLHLGVPGSSGALAVARRMGLPADVIDAAEELLGARRASVEELLASLSEERVKLSEERQALAQEHGRAERARTEAEELRQAMREQREKLRSGAHGEAVAALRHARDELDRMRVEIKRVGKSAARESRRGKGRDAHGDLAEIKARLGKVSDKVSEHAPERELPDGVRPVKGELSPGQRVYVLSLGNFGQVAEAPQRGRVSVQVGLLRSTVAVEDVLLGGAQGNASAKTAAAKSAPTKSAGRKRRSHGDEHQAQTHVPSTDDMILRTDDITVDVRGQRAEEAVGSVDRFIDQSLLSARDVIFVIHGHGTGALRSAVREHLAAHHAVHHYRAGQRAEGGDGVTIAWLDVH